MSAHGRPGRLGRAVVAAGCAIFALGCSTTHTVTREGSRTLVRQEHIFPDDGGLASSVDLRGSRLVVHLSPRRDCARVQTGTLERTTVTTTQADVAGAGLMIASGVVLGVSSGLVFGFAMPAADPGCTPTDEGCSSAREGAVIGGTLLTLVALPLLGGGLYQVIDDGASTTSTVTEPYSARHERQSCGATADLAGTRLMLDDEELDYPVAEVDTGGRAVFALPQAATGVARRTRDVVVAEPSVGAARLLPRHLVLGSVELPRGPLLLDDGAIEQVPPVQAPAPDASADPRGPAATW